MSGAAPPPVHTEDEVRAAFLGLSRASRRLMRQILTGTHSGAHPVTGTAAEAEAIAAGCIVTDGKHIWVAQEAADLVDADAGPPDAPEEQSVSEWISELSDAPRVSAVTACAEAIIHLTASDPIAARTHLERALQMLSRWESFCDVAELIGPQERERRGSD